MAKADVLKVGMFISFERKQRVVGAHMKNLGPTERVLRVAVGGALGMWALMLLLGGGGLIWLLAYVALIALGVDFVVTGIRGYCPLYNRLGWSTAPPEAHV